MPTILEPEPTDRGTARATVTPDLIDELGHMSMVHYLDLFGRAADLVLGFAIRSGLDGLLTSALVTVEARLAYRREARLGDVLLLETRLAAWDAKRMHVVQVMRLAREGTTLATAEQLFLNFDLATRRVAPFAPDIMAAAEALGEADRGRFDITEFGRRIGARSRRS